VEPDGYRASSGGRRSTLYKLNGRCRYVLGVDLEIPQLNLVICDLLGRVVHRRRRRLPLHRGDGPETLIPFVADQAVRFVKRAGLSLDDLLGIGFGAPGTVSAPAARRDATPTLSFWGETLPPWRDVPVQALLEEAAARGLERWRPCWPGGSRRSNGATWAGCAGCSRNTCWSPCSTSSPSLTPAAW